LEPGIFRVAPVVGLLVPRSRIVASRRPAARGWRAIGDKSIAKPAEDESYPTAPNVKCPAEAGLVDCRSVPLHRRTVAKLLVPETGVEPVRP
jgi:hypothetical protein